jgi:hypothetical protein
MLPRGATLLHVEASHEVNGPRHCAGAQRVKNPDDIVWRCISTSLDLPCYVGSYLSSVTGCAHSKAVRTHVART